MTSSRTPSFWSPEAKVLLKSWRVQFVNPLRLSSAALLFDQPLNEPLEFRAGKTSRECALFSFKRLEDVKLPAGTWCGLPFFVSHGGKLILSSHHVGGED